jgi:UDP-GlcNAc:undecaprenyl-phosphate GlcNAc-1-phosphate transferase
MLVLIALAVATSVAVAAGSLVRRTAPAIGAIVPPRPDRWHDQPTPTMGGIAIVIATAAGFLPVLYWPDVLPWFDTWIPVPIAAFVMFVVGLADDQLQLSPTAKLVWSLIVGAFLVFALSVTEPGGLHWSATLVATVWFAGICHAFNLLDNMDGLAAGVAFIAAAFMAVLFTDELGVALAVILVSFCGALLGFRYWNRSRARLFMGDCGSLFIGALLAGCSLVPVMHARTEYLTTSMFVMLVLSVPLFDTGFVLVLRRLAGRKASKGGTDHVSHRLVSLGFSDRSAVRILYLFSLVGGLAAWGIQKWSAVEPMMPFVALFGVIVMLIGIYLARVPAYNAQDFIALQKSSFAPFLKDLAFRWHAGQVMLDLVLITVCYYVAYRLRFEGASLDPFLQYFLSTLPIVLGCKLAALLGSGLYQRSWETFGLRDLTTVVRGVGIGSLLTVAASYYLYRGEGSSRVVFVLDALLLGAAIIATRVSFQAMNLVASSRNKKSRRVLVYGAGGYGRLLVREMRANSAWRMNPVGFIDDDPLKAHRWIVGVPVHGAIDQLEQVMRVYRVDEVLLSSPAINGNVEVRIREVCASLERPVRRLRMEIN